ncbi:hypothetical protein FDO65_20440 [Nakamurella flava]|uniref:Uncharacterized protein n=1 Tax=Nakamurella flava TaxID=2576308 RepID=A0A4U6Q8Y5_9ACTN|nr:hypothetical protein [Nakamurella flava]TKV56333.1 hypothetical protein FDO65_20440 [Nakamurella flava]
MAAADDDESDDRPTVPVAAVDSKRRQRRRVWTIYGVTAVVAFVLAATVTVPGWQRTVVLGAVVLGVVGMAAVKPLIKRAPRSADGDEDRPNWIYGMGGPPTVLVGNLIRSAGPQRGGFWALVATGVAAVFVVSPVLLALDAGLRIRRARKVADQSATLPVSEPPNPRP